jgi:hypothetical protein
MPVVALVLAVLTLVTVSVRTADGAGCRRCAFGGLCPGAGTLAECPPSRSACVPDAGILGFNSMSPNVPAYWTLFARGRERRSLRRLAGRLEVWSDYSTGPPSAPGLPERCDPASENFPLCSGARARFSGVIRNDRLMGVARYADGASCEFKATIAFGVGGTEPNTFTCRTASGEVMSQGALQLQLIRLTGCKRRPRAS